MCSGLIPTNVSGCSDHAGGCRKQEGESTAATALLRNLYTRLHHFADVLVMDALYVSRPILEKVSAQVVWEIMHARWDLENSGFHQLKTYQHLDHCYLHHEMGTEAWVLPMLWAYNLWQMFLYRHVRGFVTSGMAIVAVWETMMRQCARMRRSQALYLWGTG
ncbi:MAG: hypothetical protein ACYCYO_15665 [Bacilli bacterium]